MVPTAWGCCEEMFKALEQCLAPSEHAERFTVVLTQEVALGPGF